MRRRIERGVGKRLGNGGRDCYEKRGERRPLSDLATIYETQLVLCLFELAPVNVLQI